jgi:hypothetical protein
MARILKNGKTENKKGVLTAKQRLAGVLLGVGTPLSGLTAAARRWVEAIV